MLAAVAHCSQGMARGSDEYSQSLVPRGLGAAGEVAKRLTLWEERRFKDLLRPA